VGTTATVGEYATPDRRTTVATSLAAEVFTSVRNIPIVRKEFGISGFGVMTFDSISQYTQPIIEAT
jgi:hypothetical protein